MKKILAIFIAIAMNTPLWFAADCCAQGFYDDDEEAQIQPQLIGRWQITNARNSVKQIFDITLYDEYKTSGFVFTKTTQSYARQLSGKNTFQSYSQIELKEDGTFSAIDAILDMTSGSKASITSKTYSGAWNASGNALYLSYIDKPNEEIISDDTINVQSVTSEFAYRIEKSELTLFPKFDKRNAYVLLEYYLRNPSRLYGVRHIFYGILSNSQSALSAYSVRQLLEAIDQINENPAVTAKNMRSIKNIVEQWREGRSGLRVEKVSQRRLAKKAVAGKWYYEGEKSDLFMNIITPVMPCDEWEIFLEPKRSGKNENYSELNLKPDGSVFIHSFLTNVNKKDETYAVDLEGVWDIEGNTVSMRFDKLKHSDSGKITMQATNLLYSFRVAIATDNRLLISKNMPSAAGYIRLKEYIKNARVAQQHFPFEAIPEILNDKYSSLSAYDVLRMKQLINIINESMPQNKMEAVGKACDEMDLIIGKWYDGYVRYNK